MDFNIPEYVKRALNKIDESGCEGFIVGGCIRDLLLQKTPSDYDITTSATPDEILRIFKDYKTILIGKQFGTIVVIQPEGNIEITTYRTEAEYIDGRRPSKVSFSKNIEGDLSRRDFTINAMAYNKNKGLIDLFNGKDDLRKMIIRTVGNPRDRLNEDHLRILRGVRLATQLEFKIEVDTYKACEELSSSLKDISSERVSEELFKILLSNKPSNGIRLLNKLGILKIIIPELIDTIDFQQKNPYHDKDVFNHSLCVLDNTPPILSLRLAALLHDIGKPHTLTIDENGIGHFYGHDKLGVEITKKILTRLKCSNNLMYKATNLIKEHMNRHNEIKDKGLKRLISRVGEEDIFNLLELQKADTICSNDNADIKTITQQEQQIRDILEYKEPYNKNQLDIDGNDIIDIGFQEGKLIGEILDFLLEEVLKDPKLNEKQKLIKIVNERYGR